MSSVGSSQKRRVKLSKRADNLLKIGMVMAGPVLLIVVLEFIAYTWEQKQADGLYAWEMVASRRMEWEQFREPGAGYTLMKPGSEYEWRDIEVEINSQGLRGPEVAYEKPANTYRILNVGDSVAMGWGVGEEETYGYQLEQYLNETADNSQHFQVINAAVPGWNLANELAFLQAEGLRYEPDLVLLDITIVNDIYGPSALLAQDRPPLIEWLRTNTYFWPFLTVQLRQIEARSKGNERIDVINPPRDAVSYFPQDPNAEIWTEIWDWILEINRIAEENDSQFGIILFPLEFQVLDDEFSVLPQEIFLTRGAEAGIPVLDLLPIFKMACLEKPGNVCQLEDRYLFADVWMHPSAYGHELTAIQLQAFLEENDIVSPAEN